MREEETKKEIEMAVLHEKILATLATLSRDITEIKEQVKLTNGRVTTLEKDRDKAMIMLSKHSGIIVGYKEERDHDREELIAQLKTRVGNFEDKEKVSRERLIWGIIVTLLLLLMVSGLIDPRIIDIIRGI